VLTATYSAIFKGSVIFYLHPNFFHSTPFSWLRSTALTATYSAIFKGNAIFYLRPNFFHSTPFSWLRSTELTATYSAISEGSVIFHLRPFFPGTQVGRKTKGRKLSTAKYTVWNER